MFCCALFCLYHRFYLTHGPHGKFAVFQTTFSYSPSLMKIVIYIYFFHWNVFPMVQSIINQHFFWYWLDAEKGNKPLLEPILVYFTDSCASTSLHEFDNPEGYVLKWLIRDSNKTQLTLRWRHNGRDGVSNHQPNDCLLNRLFGRKSK